MASDCLPGGMHLSIEYEKKISTRDASMDSLRAKLGTDEVCRLMTDAALLNTDFMENSWIYCIDQVNESRIWSKTLQWKIWRDKLHVLTRRLPELILSCQINYGGAFFHGKARESLYLKIKFLDTVLEPVYAEKFSTGQTEWQEGYLGREINRLM